MGFLLNPGFPAFTGTNPAPGKSLGVHLLKKGETQIFADDIRIAFQSGILRKCHAARKLDHPVLEGTEPWEFVEQEGRKISYAGIYGSVLRDERTGLFRMWYNVDRETCLATSSDGINWQKPLLGQIGATNMIQLFGFHSPSFILDKFETDPAKRYKAIGSKDGFSKEVIAKLKAKFNSPEWYTRRHAYCAATSPDGLRWEMVPDPILLGMDTITLSQDPCTGEYLAFHKQTQDPRSFGRQVFLSTSKDMLSWTVPELAMATDEADHQEARKLEGGTHAEVYNMSAFYHAGQWLGLVTIFKCTGEPLVNGKARAGQKGTIDVQLVHSRDGRRWSRCSDRSPVIPAGPSGFDKGMVFGVCNTPVFAGDEMWMYYSASNDIHCGESPGKKASIGLAAWRLDGMVSLQAIEKEGIVETTPFTPEGNSLYVNALFPGGELKAEVLSEDGTPMPGYRKKECVPVKGSGVSQPVIWKKSEILPEKKTIRLRFFLSGGNLYSYTVQ
jgi:hypothetical protein